MDTRKEKILKTVIKEHIKTALPVSSSVLVEKYKIQASPATVRNDMAWLEAEGYIAQPHISAGRVPTEKAYEFYISGLEDKKLSSKEDAKIKEILAGKDEDDFKKMAKLLAEISGNAVFWAIHKRNLYYTGLSNLFAQPEFSQTGLIYDVSAVIDRLDEIIEEVFDEIDFGDQVLLGNRNPFGAFCSCALAKYKKNGNIGMFGILSPLRADYGKNLSLIKNILENIK